MRPPMCDICGNEEDCNLVYFRLTEKDIEWKNRMEKNSMVGHPPYAEWFCLEHIKYAEKYAHLSLKDAIKKIRKELDI